MLQSVPLTEIHGYRQGGFQGDRFLSANCVCWSGAAARSGCREALGAINARSLWCCFFFFLLFYIFPNYPIN